MLAYIRRFIAGTFLIAVAGAIIMTSIILVPALQLRLSSGHVDLYPEALDVILVRHKLERDISRLKEEYKHLGQVHADTQKGLIEFQQQKAHLKITSISEPDNDVVNDQNTFEEDYVAMLRNREQNFTSMSTIIANELDHKTVELNSANERFRKFADSSNEGRLILSKLESMLFITNPIIWAPFLVPCEILVLILAVLMGALGGVISVAKAFVTPGVPNPDSCDYFIRPLFGMAIAFVVFLFFKAGQLVISADGVDNPLNPFLIGLLGVISGMMAREAITRIEIWGSQAFGTQTDASQAE